VPIHSPPPPAAAPPLPPPDSTEGPRIRAHKGRPSAHFLPDDFDSGEGKSTNFNL
jgi:hypothetical protein